MGEYRERLAGLQLSAHARDEQEGESPDDAAEHHVPGFVQRAADAQQSLEAAPARVVEFLAAAP